MKTTKIPTYSRIAIIAFWVAIAVNFISLLAWYDLFTTKEKFQDLEQQIIQANNDLKRLDIYMELWEKQRQMLETYLNIEFKTEDCKHYYQAIAK